MGGEGSTSSLLQGQLQERVMVRARLITGTSSSKIVIKNLDCLPTVILINDRVMNFFPGAGQERCRSLFASSCLIFFVQHLLEVLVH